VHATQPASGASRYNGQVMRIAPWPLQSVDAHRCLAHPAVDGLIDGLGNTGNTRRMKTAISLPDELFRELDAKAKALKLSRSALLARAAREFLDANRPSSDATEAWNRAIERGGQPGDDEGARRARRRTKEIVRRDSSKAKK
jgi:predicted transcriptional regulator